MEKFGPTQMKTIRNGDYMSKYKIIVIIQTICQILPYLSTYWATTLIQTTIISPRDFYNNFLIFSFYLYTPTLYSQKRKQDDPLKT